LEKIDRKLRSSTPAFNGFDGLCAKLGLPTRRSNLTSWFQVSAALPAVIWSADLEPSRGYFDFTFWCFGAPHLMVEWFPQRELQRISRHWISVADDPQVPKIVSVPIADDSTAAKLILSFGKLDADVVTVDLSPLELQLGVTNTIPLEVVPEEPSVPDFGISGAPNQQEPVIRATGEAPNQKDGGRKGPSDPEVAKRRAIVKQCLDRGIRSTIGICHMLDEHHACLPNTQLYETFRLHTDPWADAYNQRPRDEKRRRCIRVILAKDKKI
jgi:hypothetical protein